MYSISFVTKSGVVSCLIFFFFIQDPSQNKNVPGQSHRYGTPPLSPLAAIIYHEFFSISGAPNVFIL